MKRLLLAILAPLLLVACQTNPHTGRSQLLVLSEAEELSMGVEAYSQVAIEAPISVDPKLNAPLLRVGRAIAAQADELRRGDGEAPYEWEFKVIDDPNTLNAWCLPGGKIAFYTGIFPVLQDEAGMAIVMGHEVCHALLRHGGERVSHGMLTQIGMGVAGIFAEDSAYREEAMGLLGMGAQFGFILPYSREHETEADRMGLMLAADAGYDPEVAIGIWQRMAALSDGQRPPELLSTHPDPLHRVENMRAWMPEAKERYERSNKQPNTALPPIPPVAVAKPKGKPAAPAQGGSSVQPEKPKSAK